MAQGSSVAQLELQGGIQMATLLKRGVVLPSIAILVVVFMIGASAWAQSPTLTITLTGQSMIRSDMRSTAPAAMPTISALLKGTDVVFTNFEATVAEPGQPNENTPRQGPGFLAPPGAVDSLKALGFNLVSTSNNHSADLKIPGFQNTLKEFARVGLAQAGIGNTMDEAVAPAILKTPKGTVALVAMASGLIPPGGAATATQPGVDELRVGPGNVPNQDDAKRILQSVRDATRKTDLVIVYQHNHVFDKSFFTIFQEALPDRLRPADWLKQWAHAVIDAGADLIVMHGAPLLHGIEIYHHKPIFYDLGNFIYNVPPTMWYIGEPIIWESVVATLEFQGRNVQSIKLRPIALNYVGEGQPEIHDRFANNQFLVTRGLPAPAEGEQATYILKRVAELSEPFGTTVAVKADTAEIVLTGGK